MLYFFTTLVGYQSLHSMVEIKRKRSNDSKPSGVLILIGIVEGLHKMTSKVDLGRLELDHVNYGHENNREKNKVKTDWKLNHFRT